MKKCSIVDDLKREIAVHIWIASYLRGCDISQEAFYEWIEKHWRGYIRERWVQHLEGNTCWEEFNPSEFDIAHNGQLGPQNAVEFVMTKLRWGWENLDFCHKEEEYEKNVQPEIVKKVVICLDINNHRYEFNQFYHNNGCECRN